MTRNRYLLASSAAAILAAATLACAPPNRADDTENQTTRTVGGRGSDRADRSSNDRGDRGGFSLFERSPKHELAEGTSIPVRLTSTVTSETANEGASVEGTVTSNISAAGKVVVPEGSRVKGRVSQVQPAKRFGGQSLIAVEWNEVTTPDGADIPVSGRMEAVGKKQVGKDTATIAGSAVGGAILGEVLDHKAAEGAVIGGGIGTAVASRKGQEATLGAGQETTVRTTSTVKLQAAFD